jgi:hypothetical protein
MQRKVVLALCFIMSAAARGYAGDGGSCGLEEWNPPSAGPVTTWTAPVCAKGEFVVQPFIIFNRTRGSFNQDGNYASLPEGDRAYQFQEQLFMQYGLTDRLEIDAQAVNQQNFAEQSGVKADSRGFGDSFLFARCCLNEEGRFLPYAAAVAQVKVPTGKYQHADPDKLGTDLMGTGSWDPGAGIILTKRCKPFIFHADAIYSMPQRVKVDEVKTRYGNYLNYDFGVEYFLPKGFNLMLEANGVVQRDSEADGERVENSESRALVVAPGIGWSCDAFQTLVAYQRTVAGKNADAGDAVVVTAAYTF